MLELGISVLTFATYLPLALACWTVWRAKAPAAAAAALSSGVLLHGAAWHLGPLAPDVDEAIGPAKRALTGCYLAFLCTFLMACFEAMPTSKAGINA